MLKSKELGPYLKSFTFCEEIEINISGLPRLGI
jgi:hypothetical protein